MNNIKIDFTHTKGTFDLDDGKICCVPSKYGEVSLCMVDGMNFTFAEILLRTGDSNGLGEVFEGAKKFGYEIEKRWNKFKEIELNNTELIVENAALELENKRLSESVISGTRALSRTLDKAVKDEQRIAELEELVKKSFDVIQSGIDCYEDLLKHDAEVIAMNDELLAKSDPFSVPSIIEQLCIATDHLLNQHDCDCHGWEGRLYAAQAGWRWLHKHGFTEIPELPRIPMSELPRRHYESRIAELEAEKKRLRDMVGQAFDAGMNRSLYSENMSSPFRGAIDPPNKIEFLRANGLEEE